MNGTVAQCLRSDIAGCISQMVKGNQQCSPFENLCKNRVNKVSSSAFPFKFFQESLLVYCFFCSQDILLNAASLKSSLIFSDCPMTTKKRYAFWHYQRFLCKPNRIFARWGSSSPRMSTVSFIVMFLRCCCELIQLNSLNTLPSIFSI